MCGWRCREMMIWTERETSRGIGIGTEMKADMEDGMEDGVVENGEVVEEGLGVAVTRWTATNIMTDLKWLSI